MDITSVYKKKSELFKSSYKKISLLPFAKIFPEVYTYAYP